MLKRSIITDLLVVLSLVVGAYVTSALAPFLSLDDLSILHGLQSSELNYLARFFGGGGDYFRPLTFVSFLLDLNLFGPSPPAFHLVNLSIHTANSFLVYYLAHLLVTGGPAGTNRAPIIAALLFALHPVNTEAVSWVAGRTDLLCCFFFLLAVIVAVDQRQSLSRSALAIFLAALLSLLAKEASVGLAGILLVWSVSLYKDERGRRMLLLAVSVACATLIYFLMRSGMRIGTDAGVDKVLTGSAAIPFWQLVYDSVAAFGFYVSKAFYPLPLNFAIVTINKPLSAGIFLCSLTAMLLLYARSPRTRLPLLIFSISLVPPVLALHGKLPWTPYAERYLYLSMTGFALLVGYVVSKLPAKVYPVVFALIALLSVPTMQRVNLWGNPLEFWREVLHQSPEFPRSYVGVACELLKEKQYDEAEVLLNKALKMGQNKEFVWHNLAMVRLGKGDLVGYESAMLKSAGLASDSTPKYISLIQTVSKNSHDEASLRRIISYYLMAQRRDHRYGDGFYNAAKVYLQLGETENALVYFRKFMDSPGDSMYKPFAEGFIKKLTADIPSTMNTAKEASKKTP